jgi:hypothetical protein
MSIPGFLAVVTSMGALALTSVPLSCADKGLYLLSHTASALGVSVTYYFDIGYQKYLLSDKSDETPHDIDTLCGDPCKTLSQAGGAFAAFSGISILLNVVGIALLLFMLCTSSSSLFRATNAVLGVGMFCDFVGVLIMLGAVATVVNGDGEEYMFLGVADISQFK